MDVEGGKHATSDSEKDHAGDDDEVVVADSADDASGDDGAKDGGQEEREDLDTSLDGTDTLDSLEVEGCGHVSQEIKNERRDLQR